MRPVEILVPFEVQRPLLIAQRDHKGSLRPDAQDAGLEAAELVAQSVVA